MNDKDYGFKVVHIGINCEDDGSAMDVAKQFEQMFQIPKVVGKDSIFTGPLLELMKGKGRGTNGHIGIAVNDICDAMMYLESLGHEFNHDSIKYNEDGSILVIYLKQEIAGFAVHLLQN